MDLLQPVTVEKWTLLRELTRKNWPIYVQYYNWITNAIKWKRRDPCFKIQIYCPNGKHESGVFIGIFSAALHTIAIFSLNESKEIFEKSLLETKVIDWNQKVLIIKAAQGDTSDVLVNILTKK